MQLIKNNKKLAGLIAGLALAVSTPAAMAADWSQGGVGLRYGSGNHYQRATLNYETPSLWDYNLGGNWGRLELTGEAGVSYWWADGSRSPSNAVQLHATPFLRWWISDRFFIEGGIGATVFNKTRFADKTISTAFQFGDQIGVGFLLTQNSKIGLRYAHFSNASIKRPNPGLDIIELGYTYRF